MEPGIIAAYNGDLPLWFRRELPWDFHEGECRSYADNGRENRDEVFALPAASRVKLSFGHQRRSSGGPTPGEG
jgi:hypothetical protein